jgi:protein O-GlcNAc transferase
VRLPALCRFRPEPDAPPANPLPACANGYFTFGSFNRNAKLGDAVVALWSRVLHAVPGSRMLLGAIDDDAVRIALIGRFAAHGVDQGRLLFQPRTDRQAYLRLHHQVDMILDTFPYSGGTTSAHAIWMGVPVLTLSGQALSSRQSATLLQHFGLPEFVAESEAEFVRAAADWAGRLDELNGLRLSLRAKISDSRLFDAALVARGLERAAVVMWQRWCDGLTPESFELND